MIVKLSMKWQANLCSEYVTTVFFVGEQIITQAYIYYITYMILTGYIFKLRVELK